MKGVTYMKKVLKRIGAVMMAAALAFSVAAVDVEAAGATSTGKAKMPSYSTVVNMVIDPSLSWLRDINSGNDLEKQLKASILRSDSGAGKNGGIDHNLKVINEDPTGWFKSRYFKKSMNKFLEAADNNASDSVQYKVTFREGTYTLVDSIKLPSNTCIDATGCTIKASQNESEYDGGVFVYNTGSKNIKIVGGTWTTAGQDVSSSNKDQSMFKFAGVTNLVMQNMKVKSNRWSHIVEIANIKNATIKGCTFSGNNQDKNESKPYNEQPKEAFQLDVDTKAAIGEYSGGTGKGCENVTFEKCKFVDVGRGLGSHSGAKKKYNNITVTKCTFKNSLGEGIYAQGWTNSTISGCSISKCKRAGISSLDSSDLLIKKNTVKDVSAYGGKRAEAYHHTAGIYLSAVKNSEISENSLPSPSDGKVFQEPTCGGNTIK